MSSERKASDYGRYGGAAGPGARFRRRFQITLLVGLAVVLFTNPELFDRRLLFGLVMVVVAADLVMLWRGDLEFTHFQSREWSFRINFIQLVAAAILFTLALAGRL